MIRAVIGISLFLFFVFPFAAGAHNVAGEEEATTFEEKTSLETSLFVQQVRNFILDPFFKGISAINKEEHIDTIEQDLRSIMNHCVEYDSVGDTFNCLHSSADKLLARYAFPDIVAAAERTPDCHDLMHHIAQGAYYIYGDLGEVYEHANFACFGAVYHGGAEGYLIEKMSKESITQEEIVDSVLTACEGVDSRAIIYDQCVHGIGHALMFVTASELPESLELCDVFDTTTEQVNCYGGVFMENVPNSQLSPHVSAYARADDPWYPCRIVDERYKNVCYTFQLSAIQGNDIDRLRNMRELCAEVPEEHQYACFLSFGSSVAATIQNQENRVNGCLIVPGFRNQGACIEGTVVSYLDRFATLPDKLSESLELCTATPGAHKEICYEAVGNILRSVSIGDREAICKRAGEWEDVCLMGGNR